MRRWKIPQELGCRYEEELRKNIDKIYGQKWRFLYNQNERYIEVERGKIDADLVFVTGNKGKVESSRRSLNLKIEMAELEISEDLQTIEEIARHKAMMAYAVLGQPIICDDSGLVIPSYGEWPGARIKRELDKMGEEKFADLFRNNPKEAYFKMAVTYLDERLSVPIIFISKVEGTLQYEAKGDPGKPFIKNPILGRRFRVKGQEKTLAEMSEEEYKQFATTNRWKELEKFLRKCNDD